MPQPETIQIGPLLDTLRRNPTLVAFLMEEAS